MTGARQNSDWWTQVESEINGPYSYKFMRDLVEVLMCYLPMPWVRSLDRCDQTSIQILDRLLSSRVRMPEERAKRVVKFMDSVGLLNVLVYKATDGSGQSVTIRLSEMGVAMAKVVDAAIPRKKRPQSKQVHRNRYVYHRLGNKIGTAISLWVRSLSRQHARKFACKY